MKYLIAWGPPLVWMTIIFLLSNRQRISVSEDWGTNFLVFKTLHMIEYGALFYLLHRALKRTTFLPMKRLYPVAFVVTVLYAISDELHQTFVPTREGTIRDVIIDSIGASLIWIFLTHLLPRLPKKLKHWVNVCLSF